MQGALRAVHVSNPSTWEVEQRFKLTLGWIVSLKPAYGIQDLISKISLILYEGCETTFGVGGI